MEPVECITLAGHTFGARIDGKDACAACPGEHGTPGPCDHGGYSRRYVRFVRAHLEEWAAAYLSPNPSTSNNVRERLEREWATLPPRHDCSCICPNQRGRNPQGPCLECRRIIEQQRVLVLQRTDIAMEVGHHGSPAHAPTPLVTMLDLYAGYAA